MNRTFRKQEKKGILSPNKLLKSESNQTIKYVLDILNSKFAKQIQLWKFWHRWLTKIQNMFFALTKFENKKWQIELYRINIPFLSFTHFTL